MKENEKYGEEFSVMKSTALYFRSLLFPPLQWYEYSLSKYFILKRYCLLPFYTMFLYLILISFYLACTSLWPFHVQGFSFCRNFPLGVGKNVFLWVNKHIGSKVTCGE